MFCNKAYPFPTVRLTTEQVAVARNARRAGTRTCMRASVRACPTAPPQGSRTGLAASCASAKYGGGAGLILRTGLSPRPAHVGLRSSARVSLQPDMRKQRHLPARRAGLRGAGNTAANHRLQRWVRLRPAGGCSGPGPVAASRAEVSVPGLSSWWFGAGPASALSGARCITGSRTQTLR